jgi:hypothetical protein
MTLFIPATLRGLLPTTTQLKTTTAAVLQHDWAPALERFCRGLAIVIAFTWTAGWMLGTWVHQSSTLLGRFAAELAEPDWHQQRLAQLKQRLQARPVAVRETAIDDPQPSLPLTVDPQTAALTPPEPKRTTRSKLPQPAPKPSRQRRPRNAKRTTAPAAA